MMMTSRSKQEPNVIFNRAFATDVFDLGKREDVQVGDVITFISDRITFMTREVAEVRGQVIVTKPFPGEKPFTFARDCITRIVRP